MTGPRLPYSRPSRLKLEARSAATGSGRKRNPQHGCAECSTPLKYDSKWPVCLACANKQLGLVGKNLLSKRVDGASRAEILDGLDDTLDLIDRYLGAGRPDRARPERRPRPGRGPRRPAPALRRRPTR